MTLRLGLVVGGAQNLDLVLKAEELGFHSVWCGEAYGADAVSHLAWIGARTQKIHIGSSILQVPARTPAMTAMTAMSLDQLTGGRFILGLGPSGPQVVEGWYGVPYGKPLTRMREYIQIIRAVLARAGPLVHQGEVYQIPYTGPGASGLGKPLKSILHGRPDLPIYTAAITPSGLTFAGEMADGVLPMMIDPLRTDLIEPYILEGKRKAGRAQDLGDFDIAPYVPLSMGEDLMQCRQPIKQWLSFYIGGMGARGKNFYNDYVRRMGFGAAATQIQELFLSGRQAEAAAAMPDELVDTVSLVGSPERIRQRLEVWKQAGARGGVGTMVLRATSADALGVVARAVLRDAPSP